MPLTGGVATAMALAAGGSALAKGIGGIIGNRRRRQAAKDQRKFLKKDARRVRALYEQQAEQFGEEGEALLATQRALGWKFGQDAGHSTIEDPGEIEQGLTSLQRMHITDAGRLQRDQQRILDLGKLEAKRILNQAGQMKTEMRSLDVALPFQIGASALDIFSTGLKAGKAWNPDFMSGS